MSQRLHVLVISAFTGTNANVIADYLFAFNAYSRHRYTYVFDPGVLDREIDLSTFDVILIFWSVYLLGPAVREEVRERIARSPALKVLFLQDEYRDVRPMNEAMRRLGIQVMCTCVAEDDHEHFYPKVLIPSLEARYTVLTGYVPSYLEGIPLDLETRRPLDIAYRSRAVPYWLGDLGQEKRIVAERFQALAWERGLRSDISVREEDRIYGRRWVEFLRSARFVLGTASGASVVDFTGEIRASCERYLAEHPEVPYDEVKRRFFAHVDGRLVIDTVSPRIFESAALGCTLVLHEGHYGGLLRPDEHYIMVKRDYSNAGDVLDRMADRTLARAFAARAHQDLIASGAYTYRTFAERFDAIVARHQPGVVARAVPRRAAIYARNYLRHDQTILPWGAGFVTVPRMPRPTSLARRLPRARVPVVDVPVTKVLLALWWTFADSRLRMLFLRYLRHRDARREVPVAAVLRDCARSAILGRARAGRLAPSGRRQTFGVVPTFEGDGSRLVLRSRRLGAHEHETHGMAQRGAADTALRAGAVRQIVWDHSPVGPTVAVPLIRVRRIPFVFDDGGYVFASFAVLLRHLPEEMVAVLGPLASATCHAPDNGGSGRPPADQPETIGR